MQQFQEIRKGSGTPLGWMLVAGLMLQSLGVFSQYMLDSLYQLEEVIVTATRTEREPGEVGRSVTVLSRKEIERSGAGNVAELLTRLAGIYVVGAGQTPGALQSLYMRGSNRNQTVILIDGVRITDPSTVDNAIDLSELSLLQIERIEIVRGSHSTLYGTSAVGGIIHIITSRRGEEGLHGQASTSGGTFGRDTWDLTQQASLKFNSNTGFYVHGDLYHTRVEGLDATLDTVTRPGVFRTSDMDGFKKTDAGIKAGYRNKRWDVFAGYKVSSQKADVDDGAYRDDENHTVSFDRQLLTYGVAAQINPHLDLRLMGGWTGMDRIAIDDSSVVDAAGNFDRTYFEGRYNGSVINHEVQAHLRLEGLEAVLGAGRYDERMGFRTYFLSTAFGFESEVNLDTPGLKAITDNVFLHIDLDGTILHEKLNGFGLALGTRWNQHNVFGQTLTYEVNPSFVWNDRTMLYGSFSTGFNAPSLYQMFAQESYYTSGITRGNNQLVPETSQSFELGFRQGMGQHTQIGLAWFYTIVDDVIDYVYLWDGEIPIEALGSDVLRDDFRGDTYLNIGKLNTQGIEVSMETKLSEKLTLSGNFSLVLGNLEFHPDRINREKTEGHHVQVFSGGAFLTGQTEKIDLVRRPNTANLSLGYMPTSRVSIRGDLRYVGPRSDIAFDGSLGPFGALGTMAVRAYTLFDLSARYRISEEFRVGLALFNVFDADYLEINGYRAVGRRISGRVTYVF